MTKKEDSPKEAKKVEKKKLIVVDDRNTSRQDPYGSNGMRFAFLSKLENGKRVQATGFMSCRDGVCSVVRGHVKGSYDNGTYKFGIDAPIDMENLRLLMVKGSNHDKNKVDAEVRDKIFSGKAAVNLYEDFAGWKRSKITTVNHSSGGKQVWLMTGSGNWMKAPSLVSMVTLIMRLSSWYGPLKTDSLKQLENHWEELCKKNPSGSDIPYLKECWRKFPLVVKHADKIFPEPFEQYYPQNGFPSGNGGILTLCKFQTNMGKVDQRFKEIWEEHNKK